MPTDTVRDRISSAVLLGGILSSCGAGVAGVVASSGGNGGGNSPPSIANLQVPASRSAPARIVVELSDREGQSIALELAARVPLAGGGMSDLTPLSAVNGTGFPANGAVVAIPGGNQALALDLQWHFDDESFPDWPHDGRYVEGVQLVARLASGSELVLGDDELFSVGNDAPEVTFATPIVDPDAGEVAGIARVEVGVMDSSDDVISVQVEFDVQGDDPDESWKPATGFGLEEVRASRNGTTLDFFWDTDADLDDLEREVVLRFRPTDFALDGTAVTSASFRVDNNAAPTVTVSDGLLVADPDKRRGITIPFLVEDEEGDEVELVFQWRRPEEGFPELPGTPAAIREALADPEQRRALHVCSEYPRATTGALVPIDATTVELPELATSASQLLAEDLVGQELEILRPSQRVKPIHTSWTSNALQAPVAALPIGDGRHALVLDSPGGGWRLVEIDLASGELVRTLAAGDGPPSTAVWERGGTSVLVASESFPSWRVERVELESGARTTLIEHDGSVHPAPLRGLASLGASAALATVGSALVQLAWADPANPSVAELIQLAMPWGVVLDPLRAGHAYVAEHDASVPGGTGRVVSVDLARRVAEPIVAVSDGVVALPRPRDLTLARDGSRLLVLCEVAPSLGRVDLLAVDLGSEALNEVFDLGTKLGVSAFSLATGPDELTLAVVRDGNGVLAGGGLEQRRTISSLDRPRRRVGITAPFVPALRPGGRWRMFIPFGGVGPATSSQGVFVWDSSDAASGGQVLFRATPFDAEVGRRGTTLATKEVLWPLGGTDSSAVGPGDTSFLFRPPTPVDLDRDGDLDLLGTFSTVAVSWQTGRRGFEQVPTVLTDRARGVEAADLDRDGLMDVVVRREDDRIAVVWQTSKGIFDVPVLLGGAGMTDGLLGPRVSDLDGDQDLDLVSANHDANTLTIFWQTSPRVFDPLPQVLGGAGITYGPRDVRAIDLDGDHDVDLVSANIADPLTVFWQTNHGVFAPALLPVGGSSAVYPADMDCDGDLDLLSLNNVSPSLTIFWQTGPGAFDPEPSFVIAPTASAFSWGAQVADIDGDGKLDIVVQSVLQGDGTAEILVFWQTDAGVFEPASIGVTRYGFRFLDVDRDGDHDYVTANSQDGVVYLQTSPRAFDSNPAIVGSFPEVVALPEVEDMDGDGQLDLITTNSESRPNVLWHSRPGAFDPDATIVDRDPQFGRPWALEAADIDGDGRLDLASAQGTDPGGALVISWQNRTGAFDATTTIPVEVEASCLKAVDLDGDGDLELATTDYIHRTVTVYRQDGPRAFELTPLVLGGPSPSFVEAGDLDADGDLDLVSANFASGLLAFFLQTSPGEFDPVPHVLGGFPRLVSPTDVVPADFDSDGDLDLVATSSFNLAVFRQTGDAQFAANPIKVGAFFYGIDVLAEDVDGDGDLDLAVAQNGESYSLMIFWKTGATSFAATPTVIPSYYPLTLWAPTSLRAADVDRDGDLDLVASYVESIGIHRQTTPGNFVSVPTAVGGMPTTRTPRSLQVADIDGDGDPDLAVANDGFLSIFSGSR